MKKIFSILVLSFLVFFAKAQMQDITGFGFRYNALDAKSMLNIPSGVVGDTVLTKYKKFLKPGAMFYDSVTNTRYIWHHAAVGDYWAIDDTGGGGIDTAVDTIFVTPIGVAAGMIQTLYVVDGNLRVSNWGNGFGTIVHLASDSLAYIDLDTNQVAFRQWVINNYGVGTGGNIAGLDGVLAVNQNLTANRSSDFSTFTWSMTSSALSTLNVVNTVALGTAVTANASTAGTNGYNALVTNGTGYSVTGTNGTGYYANMTSGNGIEVHVTDGVGGIFFNNGASTNTVTPVFFIERQTPGTAANGIGGSLVYAVQDAGGGLHSSNTIESVLTDASAANRTSRLVVKGTLLNASLSDVLYINGNGTIEAPGIANWVNAANNAAAIAASVPVGRFYRNGDVVQIVH